MLKKLSVVALSLIVLIVIGCQMDLFKQEKGSLSIYFEQHIDRTTAPPDEETELSYFTIKGNGPADSFFEESLSDSVILTKQNILAGEWMITVEAYNVKNKIIGSGISYTIVKVGISNDVTIQVNAIKGEGTLSIKINYNDQGLASPAIIDFSAKGTLTPLGGNTPIQLTFSTNTPDKAFESTAVVQNGYYTIELEVKKGSQPVKKYVDIVWILAYFTTNGEFEFKYMQPSNEIVIRPVLDLNKPLDVSISYSPDGPEIVDLLSIYSGDTVSLKAGCNTYEPVNYEWYLDGVLEPESNKIAFTLPGLSEGEYTLMLIVKRNDNKCAGSTSITVMVQTPAPPIQVSGYTEYKVPKTSLPDYSFKLIDEVRKYLNNPQATIVEVKRIIVTVVGAGGGGAGSYCTSENQSGQYICYYITYFPGGGGGAGQLTSPLNYPLDKDTPITVVVGQGGTGGVRIYDGSFKPGTPGSESSFGPLIHAVGGHGANNMSGGSGYPAGSPGAGGGTGYSGTCPSPTVPPYTLGFGGDNGSGYGKGGDGEQNGQNGYVRIDWVVTI
jgi:hypothetical protein